MQHKDIDHEHEDYRSGDNNFSLSFRYALRFSCWLHIVIENYCS